MEQELYFGSGAAKHNTLLPKDADYDNGSRLLCAVGQYGTDPPLLASDGTTALTDAQQILEDRKGSKIYDGKRLIIPLNFFFTKAPSHCFPMCAVAGSHDVRIQIKLRPLSELLIIKTTPQIKAVGNISAQHDKSVVMSAGVGKPLSEVKIKSDGCKLRVSYVHVTGPEATDLMNSEQVRLMKLWMPHPVNKLLTPSDYTSTLFDFELPFLHPVQELIIVIRKVSEISNSTDMSSKPDNVDQGARAKNRFAFQGGGRDPNIESIKNMTYDGAAGGYQADVDDSYLEVDSFKLTLNGQERHPSLAATGLDRRYLMERVMPQLHSNTSSRYTQLLKMHSEHAGSPHYNSGIVGTQPTQVTDSSVADFRHLEQCLDRKEIYVYPFCVNPEGSNPSGAVNFSKVSHAKLSITGKVFGQATNYQCDVHAVYYNWLSIKDGRAVTSFA